eukprot:scaffold1596_cov302-Pinguiococcus_pyrenoidosus.AAC.36
MHSSSVLAVSLQAGPGAMLTLSCAPAPLLSHEKEVRSRKRIWKVRARHPFPLLTPSTCLLPPSPFPFSLSFWGMSIYGDTCGCNFPLANIHAGVSSSRYACGRIDLQIRFAPEVARSARARYGGTRFHVRRRGVRVVQCGGCGRARPAHHARRDGAAHPVSDQRRGHSHLPTRAERFCGSARRFPRGDDSPSCGCGSLDAALAGEQV